MRNVTEPKDIEFVNELIKATQAGKVRWGPTAKQGEFTASFKGKFSVVVTEGWVSVPPHPSGLTPPPPPLRYYELKIVDEFGSVLRKIDDPSVEPLLDAARRAALHSDKAIDEILEELKVR